MRSSPRSARRDSIVAFWFSARFRPARRRRLSVSACEIGLRLAGSMLAFGKQHLQACDFRLQGKGILRRAADVLCLFDSRFQFVAAAVKLPLQRTRAATGVRLRPA